MSGSGIVSKVRDFFTNAERLSDAASAAAQRAEKAGAEVEAARRALTEGTVTPGPGMKALTAAQAAHAEALAEAGELADAVKAATAARDEAESKAEAEAEAARQAAILASAEKLDPELERAFHAFLRLAERATALRLQLSSGAGADFHVAALIGRVSREACSGAARVLPLDVALHGGLHVRLPDPAPVHTATLAEMDRERQRQHRESRRPPAVATGQTEPFSSSGTPARFGEREAS